MNELQGKTAIITGGGSGIGLAIAKLFLDAGAQVTIVGRNKAKLDDAAQSLPHRDRLHTCAADLSVAANVSAMVQEVMKKFGKVDILVNNAGTNLKERTFQELTPEAWDMMIRANLNSAFYCIHAVAAGMIARKDGLIINISSVAGKRATPLGGIAYAAAKFGMTALGIGLGMELKDTGIRVTNVYPGEVDTPILEFRPSPVSDEHRQRILRPEDIARAVHFVAVQPANVSIPEMIVKPTWQGYV